MDILTPEQRKPNCLSNWFPKIEKAGLPVPKTSIIKADPKAVGYIRHVINGDPSIIQRNGQAEGKREFEGLTWEITKAVARNGLPCFLRSGMTSGKHEWKDTCYIKSAAEKEIVSHVLAIAEYSEMVDFCGLDYDVWVVREFIRGEASFTTHRGLPVNREFRFFVRDGEVVCHHPYWPSMAIRSDDKNWRGKLKKVQRPLSAWEFRDLSLLSREANRAVGGSWSVDWLWSVDKQKWILIDMALAEHSFHMPNCRKWKK